MAANVRFHFNYMLLLVSFSFFRHCTSFIGLVGKESSSRCGSDCLKLSMPTSQTKSSVDHSSGYRIILRLNFNQIFLLILVSGMITRIYIIY